jgi:hypothetical protein
MRRAMRSFAAPRPIPVLLVATLLCTAANGSADDGPTPVAVMVRTCPTLEPVFFVSALEARAPGVTFVTPNGPAADSTVWLAEICLSGTDLTSTLTNTATGASDTRHVPVPSDLDAEGTARLAATVLAAQIRAAFELEAARRAATDNPDAAAPPDSGPEASNEEEPFPLDLLAGISFESVGGLSGDIGRPSVGLGAALRLGVTLDRIGHLEVRAGSLGFLGPTDVPASVAAVPIEISGGACFSAGPLALGALASFFVEHWSPSGQVSEAGWRVGAGASGRMSWPITRQIEVHVDGGVQFFPEAYVFGYGSGEDRVIVASLANWRWRAALGFAFRIQLF